MLDPGLRGMVRVLGGPGTGKSSLLIDVAATRIRGGTDPESVLLLTGSGRISAQARSALTAKLLGSQNVGARPAVIREPLVRSVHSYAFAVLRLAAQRAPADPAAARRLAVDQKVLADREVGNDGRMLIDAGDLSTPRFPVGNRRRRLAGKTNLAAVGLAQPGEDSDQRRLSRAVAANQRMRFARHDADTGVAQREGRAVTLADPDRLDDRQNAGRARIAAPAQHRGIGHESFDAAF